MRRLTSFLLIFALCLALLTACGASNDGTQSDFATNESASVSNTSETANYDLGLEDNGYYRNVVAKKYITMPKNWQEYTVPEDVYTVSDEEIQSEMDYFVSHYQLISEIEEKRPAEIGDVVNIDFEGTVDGIAFTGGTSSQYLLELGAGLFIEGFEEQIVGHNKGDSFDVTVTFPENYGTTTDRDTGKTEIDLSNKEAVFHVTLNSINQYDLEDADVADIMYGKSLQDGTPVETVDTLRAYTEETLRMNQITSNVQQYFIDNVKIKRDDTRLVAFYLETNRSYVEQQAEAYGMDVETFVSTNSDYATLDDYIESLRSLAEENVLLSLVAQYMAEDQDYIPTEDEVRAFIGDTYDDEAELYGKGTLAHELLYNQMMGQYCLRVYENSVS